MTLDEAKAKWLENPIKRIIRAPNWNRYGCNETYFTVDPEGRLVVHSWWRPPAVTNFQQSDHTDWILI